MGKKNSQAKEKAQTEAPEPAESAVPAPEPKPPIQVVYCSGALDIVNPDHCTSSLNFML